MWVASETAPWIPLYALMLFFLVRKFGKQSWLPILCVAAAVAMSDQFSVHFAKDVFMRYRPTHNLILQSKIIVVNNYRGGMYGFVSSHAANTMSLFTFMFLLMRKRYINVILLCYLAIVWYSRVYLGVHYPTDIAGGAILGTITGSTAYGLYLLGKKRFFPAPPLA